MTDPIDYFIAATGWDPRADHGAHVEEFRKREGEQTGTPAPAAPAPKNLAYWSIEAVLIWICTRDLLYVQRRLTGGAQDDEDPVFLLTEFKCEPEGDKKRSLVVSKKQAEEEILARFQSGELEARGVLCNPSNGEPVSGTAQIIPACDWVYLRLRPSLSAYHRPRSYPSWQHIVCSSATVRKLWPQDQIEAPEAAQASQPVPQASWAKQLPAFEPDSAKPLDKGYLAILDFLKTWTPKKGLKNPYHGAWRGALSAAAKALGVTFERAKQKYGKTATDEIKRYEKS